MKTTSLALAIAASLLLTTGAAHAQGPRAPTAKPPSVQTPVLAMPYYTGEQALQGVYTHHLPPLSQAFVAAAEGLAATSERHCSGQASMAELRTAWQQALLRWQALSSPAVGPLVARRSQRQIDFWPTRPQLLQQALARAPQTLADMDRVGTPAKGFPALEQLLAQDTALTPAQCRFATLAAQAIAVEARELQAALDTLARKDWSESPEDTGTAFAEWINQWLGGLERLRWAHIEKPLQSHRTAGRRGAVEFPRHTRETNLADWRAQWQSLRAQARLTPAQLAQPPQPGQSLVPIEALLMGKGQLALAQRWAQALDAVNAGMAALKPQASARELLALTQRMKAVTVLYQNEVAGALDVPLGFSDADGD